MEKEIVVDVGKNVTALLQELAVQMGVAVDTIFPWYVKQVYINAIANAISTVLLIVTLFIVGSIGYRIRMKKNKNRP